MEKKEMDKISSMWDTKGKDLLKPSILVAMDKKDKIFYVIEDNSTIYFMVYRNSNITYCIPKKYVKKEANIYRILNDNKLISVSCSSKNKYENFVQKYLLSIK